MIKNRDRIINYFDSLPDSSVVAVNSLYEDKFTKMSQDAFFRAVERIASEGIITRLSKGLYVKKIEEGVTKEDVLLNYFFGDENDSGMFIGMRLYNKYSLTTIKSDIIELYSNKIKSNISKIDNLIIKRPLVELDFDNTRVIEALEILQNYYDIPELNKLKFARYAKSFARGYNDEAAVLVLSNMKYKKSTIAFLKKILDMYKVKNSLQQYLSYASDYKVPTVQKLAR
ncbi:MULTISPECIES: hypothetical protein [Lachnospira]|jgi:hypothetical protein|uniref:Transcriptional regulator, AbiEi antitoxin, Type IV TA system n=1 Tax=Lachnospira multipara TaxID=28051 RepID=A0A1H5VJ04_9FIRM|nr:MULTISPECIES: hypothetical protein [Lachnospira]MCR5516798.1 hypothetical protein [Lachnospira sp.]SEF87200.1 hypothetical protein SAMN05216537_11168 [Lachnospira multipara]